MMRRMMTTLLWLSGGVFLGDFILLFVYGWPSWMMSIPNYLAVGSGAVAGMSAIWRDQIDKNAASIASGGPRVITGEMAHLTVLLVIGALLGLAVWALT
jgi:hypothetical protein